MRLMIMGLLNRLDKAFRPVDAPQFSCEIDTDQSGNKVFHVRGLKVLIYKNREDWIAQGLDIGFSASGRSIEEARERFTRGLFATIDQNVRRFDSLAYLVGPAAPKHWIAWRRQVRRINRRDDGRCQGPDDHLFNGSELAPQFYLAAA